jgi:radical SAM protein with 4Fe4S-binding SPASM domain
MSLCKIQISVDSVIPGEASYLTGVSGYFKRAQKSITNLINAGIHPIVKSVLTPYNYKSFTETINYFTSIGVTEFQFVQYSRSPYRHRDDLFLTLEQKKWLSRTSEQLNLLNRKDINITIQTDTEEHDPLKRLNSKEWQDRSICSGGRSTFCILNNGDISLCEQMPHQPQYIFGNVSGSSVLNMWNNPKITNFLFAPRNQFLNSPCHDCAEFEICHFCKGYCYREALFNYGSVFDAPPDCPFQKKPALRRI